MHLTGLFDTDRQTKKLAVYVIFVGSPFTTLAGLLWGGRGDPYVDVVERIGTIPKLVGRLCGEHGVDAESVHLLERGPGCATKTEEGEKVIGTVEMKSS